MKNYYLKFFYFFLVLILDVKFKDLMGLCKKNVIFCVYYDFYFQFFYKGSVCNLLEEFDENDDLD